VLPISGTDLLFLNVEISDSDQPRWADPEIFAINKEPAHAFSLVFPDEASARPEPDWDNPFAASSRYMMLNGLWKFQWSESPANAPLDFYRADFDVSAWDEIPVPLPWQIAGYGQLYYFNAALPMVDDPRNRVDAIRGPLDEAGTQFWVHDQVPSSFLAAALDHWVPTLWNPVGSYRRTFTVPAEWDGERVVLHFSGVKSAFTCWVNGKEVGYSQDSFSASEFDVTRYLQPGENTMAVQVVRWSDGTYQEVQDMIRMSGIFRDVYLFATPKAHLGDFRMVADVAQPLDQAEFGIDVELRNTDSLAASGYSVELELLDPAGQTVLLQNANIAVTDPGTNTPVSLRSTVSNPLLWHPASPHLYTALIKLRRNGQIEEVVRQDVAFRRFEWDALGDMFLNGQRYVMRGVNRHDHSEQTGRTVSYQEMLEDVATMRRLNINNVRNAHYPRDPRWYALCNRYGITLIDECNLESHPVPEIHTDPASEVFWREQTLFRMRNMVAANLNQPSILIWSLGNEQFERKELPIVEQMYNLTKSIDPTRGAFCERMFSEEDDVNHGPYLDFIGPMYRGTSQYIRWHQTGQDRRPFFMSEYAHAMGNSMADLSSLWSTLEGGTGMNGGQIWDWVDQGLLWPLPGLAGEHWTYGGDWGAYGNGSVFCMNGIVLPDRSFNGKSHEAKAVYQQVEFSSVFAFTHKVLIQNKFAMQNLDEFDVEWVLLESGRPIRNGIMAVSIPPLSTQEVNLPFEFPEPMPGQSYQVDFNVKLRQATLWADQGFVVAQGQMDLVVYVSSAPEIAIPPGAVLVSQTAGLIHVQAGDLSIDFDKTAAVLSQISVGGTNLLAPDGVLPGVELNVNSWLTDDRMVWPSSEISSELQAGMNDLDHHPVSVALLEEGANFCRVETVADYLVSGENKGFRHIATYTILGSKTIQVENRVQKINLSYDALCFRIGIRLPVGKEFDVAEYAAKGPYENYDARDTGARFGQYVQPAAEWFGNYVRPQECGNRSDLEWMALRNDAGLGLVVVPSMAGDGSVMPWTREEAKNVRHVPELPESTRWVLRYDAWQAILDNRSNISFSGERTFSYSIRPLLPGQDPAAVALPKPTGTEPDASFWFDHGSTSGNDLWSSLGNWNTGALPGSADKVYIYPHAGAGGRSQVDVTSTVAALVLNADGPTELEILPGGDLAWGAQARAGFGLSSGWTNTLTLSGGSLDVDTAGTWLVFGDNGVGTLNMNAGLLKTGNLRIDFDKPGGSGRAHVTGGTIDLSGVMRIGLTGVLEMTAGEIIIRGVDDRSTLQSYLDSGQIIGSPAMALTYDGADTHLAVLAGFTYADWADEQGLAGAQTNRLADLENGGVGDGMENQLEYVLGGDPLANDAATILPTVEFAPDSIEYVYRRRIDFALHGLAYDLMVNTNGLQDPWINEGTNFVTKVGPIDADFESVTNTFDITGLDLGFLNLGVTEN